MKIVGLQLINLEQDPNIWYVDWSWANNKGDPHLYASIWTWCYNTYGDAHDSRWVPYAISGQIEFKQEKDAILFMLKWA